MNAIVAQRARIRAEAADSYGLGRDEDHPERQGERRAGSDSGLSQAGRAMRLCAASGADRSGLRIEGNRRHYRGAFACCYRKASATRFALR